MPRAIKMGHHRKDPMPVATIKDMSGKDSVAGKACRTGAVPSKSVLLRLGPDSRFFSVPFDMDQAWLTADGAIFHVVL